MRLVKMVQAKAPPPKPPELTSAHVQVPTKFIAFCAWLGVVLSLGQTVVGKVAYDGMEPKDLVGEEREAAREIFGPVDVVPPEARAVFVGVCGGRGGKSYVLVALRLVWGMYVRDLSSIAPGQHPAALVVAPKDMLRQEVINYAVGAIRSKPELKATLIVPKGTPDDGVVSGFSVRRPDGHVVDFVAGVATKGGYGGRGRAWTDAALDECAFFQDESFRVNDKDIFDAASARVLPGGQTLPMSTPWAEAGLLFDLYDKNFGAPKTALVAHAPTLTLNPSPMTQAIVARGRASDPDNAAREYDAKFMKDGTTVFFPPSLIEGMICKDLSVDEPRFPEPGESVSAGVDLGFRSNSSALAITHQGRDSKIRLGELVEEVPEDGRPLKPRAVIANFAARMLTHGVTIMMGDQHYADVAREDLAEQGISFLDAPATPDEVYVRCRQMMREDRLRIPNNPRLIKQLKDVKGRPVPGGRMQIVQPQWAKGAHGDLVSAFVLGVWMLASDTVPKPKPAEGSPEWTEQQREARAEKFRDEEDRPHWKARGGQQQPHWRRA
jgi:hypothetical protein